MSTANPPKLMTVAELDAIPEDGIDRELIRGELRIRGGEQSGDDMTRRNRYHAATEATLAKILGNWLDRQPQPRGKVFSGEVGCVLRRSPDTSVGIDVAYFSAATLKAQSNTSMIDGAPVLAVEILSPSDKLEDVNEKVDEYLAAGVALVWVVDPHFQTVTVFQADDEPELFNKGQALSAGQHLPGLSIIVSELFA